MLQIIILLRYSMYALVARYCERVFLNKSQCCCNTLVKPVDRSVHHTFVNFTKRNVPFTNKMLIKPLYDSHNKLTYLMGTTYNDMPPTHVTLFSENLNEIIDEMECLPFAISLTKPIAPFNIVHVNSQWLSLCGYNLQDMVGNTFSNVQGNSVACKKNAALFNYKMLKAMISIILSLISKNLR